MTDEKLDQINLIKLIEIILDKNYKYVQIHGYKGYDPQLYWYLFFTNKANHNPSFINKVFRKIEINIIKYFPKLLKPYLKLLKIDGMELVPYGLGVFLQAYVNLYQILRKDQYLDEAKKVAKLLESKLIITENGRGIPDSEKKLGAKGKLFNSITNNNTIYLPGGAEAFFGFFNLYEKTNNTFYLEIAKSIVDAFIFDFKLKELNENQIVLNYSNANDDSHVLNANALAGAAIGKICKYYPSKEYKSILEKIYYYLMPYLEYKEIPYAGVEDRNFNKYWNTCDTYHTGFTLRGLYDIALVLNQDTSLIIRKVKNMMEQFIDKKGNINVYSNQSSNITDIHAVAEYIHIYAKFYEFFSGNEHKKYNEVVIKNINKMIKPDKSSYFYKKYGNIKIDLYMPRWGQAPMMNALSILLQKIK